MGVVRSIAARIRSISAVDSTSGSRRLNLGISMNSKGELSIASVSSR